MLDLAATLILVASGTSAASRLPPPLELTARAVREGAEVAVGITNRTPRDVVSVALHGPQGEVTPYGITAVFVDAAGQPLRAWLPGAGAPPAGTAPIVQKGQRDEAFIPAKDLWQAAHGLPVDPAGVQRVRFETQFGGDRQETGVCTLHQAPDRDPLVSC